MSTETTSPATKKILFDFETEDNVIILYGDGEYDMIVGSFERDPEHVWRFKASRCMDSHDSFSEQELRVILTKLHSLNFLESDKERRSHTIPIADCKHGNLYKLDARNMTYGIYSAPRMEFCGIRDKLGSRFLDREYHYDIGDVIPELTRNGTAIPLEDMGPSGFDVTMPMQNCDKDAVFAYLDGVEKDKK